LNEYFILLSLNSSHIPFMEEIEALLSNYEKELKFKIKRKEQ
jgi:hypothetical protein